MYFTYFFFQMSTIPRARTLRLFLVSFLQFLLSINYSLNIGHYLKRLCFYYLQLSGFFLALYISNFFILLLLIEMQDRANRKADSQSLAIVRNVFPSAVAFCVSPFFYASRVAPGH